MGPAWVACVSSAELKTSIRSVLEIIHKWRFTWLVLSLTDDDVSNKLKKTLEKKIAEFHGREDAILYPSCFDANAGLFEVLLSPDDAVISDELNHASIIDGIRLCKAKKFRYKHKDMAG